MADENVVHLVPVADVADPDCVERLGNLLEAAKIGQITSFTAVAQGPDRVIMSSTLVADLPTMIGHVAILHADLVARATQEYRPQGQQ